MAAEERVAAHLPLLGEEERCSRFQWWHVRYQMYS